MIEVERRLGELAAQVVWPPTPPLAATVTAELRRRAAVPAPRRRLWPRMGGWPRLLPAAVALLLVAASLLAVSGVRDTVAGWLGLRGVRFEQVPTLPAIPTHPVSPHPTVTSCGPSPAALVGADLDLGCPVSLATARAEADFSIAVPGSLGDPDAVYVDLRGGGVRVSLVYRARPGLAATTGGVGLLLTEFRGDVKRAYLQKVLGSATRVDEVIVSGLVGYYIGGAPHEVAVVGPDGELQEETLRLSGPVLLWVRGPVTLRIEAALDEPTMLAVARDTQ